MTIGELYDVIEDLLRRHGKPLPLVHIARFVYSATDATAYYGCSSRAGARR